MPATMRTTFTPTGKTHKRVLSLPVQRVLPRGGDSPEAKADDVKNQLAALYLAAKQSAVACNAMIAKWLGAHYVAGTAANLRTLEGSMSVQFSDSALNLEIYHAARAAAPELVPLNVGATFQWWAKSFKGQTSPRDNVKRWRQVLRGAEAAPFYGDEQPIRLAPNAVKLRVTDDAIVVEAKVLAGAPALLLELKHPHDETVPTGSNGQKYQERWRTAANLTRVNGGMLVRERGRWSFRPVVERESVPIPEDRGGPTLLLRASSRAPFAARMNGRTALLFADLLPVIENARLELMAVRSEENAAGRKSPRNKRREAAVAKWSNTCATFSRQVVSYVGQWCQTHGVSRIAFTAGDDACVLSCCGLSEEELAGEPSRFPYRQFAEFLQQKCVMLGIEVVYTPNLRSVKRRKALRRLRLESSRVRGAAV